MKMESLSRDSTFLIDFSSSFFFSFNFLFFSFSFSMVDVRGEVEVVDEDCPGCNRPPLGDFLFNPLVLVPSGALQLL